MLLDRWIYFELFRKYDSPLKLTLGGVARFVRFISLGHLDISRCFDKNRLSKQESAEKLQFQWAALLHCGTP